VNQSDIRSRLIVVGVVVVVSLYFLYGTFQFARFSLNNPFPEKASAREEWEKERNELLKGSIRPGLDLMGGVDVLLSIDETKVALDELDDLRSRLRRSFTDSQIPASIRLNEAAAALEVQIADNQMRREALDILNGAGFREAFQPFDADQFLATGRARLELSGDLTSQLSTGTVERTRDLIRERVDSLGLIQPSVAVQGTNAIRIQLPGETDPAGTVSQVVRPAFLEFRLLHPRYDSFVEEKDGATVVSEGARREIAADPDADWVVLPGRLGRENDATGQIDYTEAEFVLRADAPISGKHISSARAYSAGPGAWEILVTFEKSGVQKMAELSRANVGQRMAIVLDGVVRTAPVIESPILNGQCTIQGAFTVTEATQLAKIISTGALPVKLRTESSRVIGAKLGTDSIRAAVNSLVYGGLAVGIFMVLYYAGAGGLAVAAIVINVLVIMALLAAWGGTLTLSGIAGILLTIGMAVDSNVLIYERIREELRAGKRAADAIAAGFDNASSTIVDANLTTLIAALILLQFGEGSVQGFALTMTFGIFTTLFAGLYVTRAFFGATYERRGQVSVGKMSIFTNPSFDFVGKRWIFYSLSAALIGLGAFSIYQHGGLILGADFKGGVIAEATFPAGEGTESIRRKLADADERLRGVDVVEIQNSNTFLVKTKLLGEGGGAVDFTTDIVEKALAQSYGQKAEIASIDTIGDEVSADFAKRAIVSCVLACLGILLYVWIRFEFWFGLAAVAALVHDVVVTVGLLTFLNIEITLDVVAALLVLIGYSINDTIVIFDRIRELLATHLKDSFRSIANLANNQTLSRTIITSFTVLLAVGSLLGFAGAGLRDFSITLLIGLITGAYSTAFIATPLLVAFTGGEDAARSKGEKR
jgi:SecD/SecF fusion protein